MTDLHWETVTSPMREVMRTLGQSDLFPRFYLAGGTALALQLGHRRSVDLDSFSETDEVRPEMHRRAMLALEPFQPVTVEQAWGNLVFLVESSRVFFFGYGYKLVAPTVQAEGVPLVSITDIGLMKLDALAGRATRKDFYDLYAISRHVSLRDLLDLAPIKCPSVRDFEAMVLRYMVYFERAEQEEAPSLIQDVSWATVKAFFREEAVSLGRGWLA